jgi:Zn-dependent peptidase ImmA (M78 family)/transcriptional regulator with XRE-family HTH domain
MVQTNIIGEKLRLVRFAWGRSLDELGGAAQVTRQYGHQLETGARVPNNDMLQVFAELLGVTPRFFHVRHETSVMPEQCHFRKQLTTPAYITSQVLARGTLLDSLIGKFDTILKLPNVDFPDLTVRDREDIERVAEQCRKHWKLGVTAPITNMMRVVENAGAVVTYFDGVSERVDAFSMDRPRPVIVRSTLKQSLFRQRFDLAHECGHLIMHRGISTGDRETEDQANRFASAFLLPRAGFIPEFPVGPTLNWRKIFQLKLRWKVSARAIVHRAHDLRLITARQYRTANIYFMKTRQARSEKYDDVMPTEQPELMTGALSALETKRPEMLRRAVDDLGWENGLYHLLTGRQLPPPVAPKSNSNVVLLRAKS